MGRAVAIGSVAVAAALACLQPASAQTSFSGVNVGVTGGYGWGTATQTGLLPPSAPPVVIPDDDAKFRTRGGLIGGALGWNAQYGTWLAGIEGDYSYASVSGDLDTCGTIPHRCGARLETLGTVRGKLGAVFNDWMLYATGGWAFGEVSGYSAAKSSGEAMYSGWTVGAGFEKRFLPQWSLKLEYLYTDLGNKDLYEANVPGFPENVSYKLSSLRLGISYYFTPDIVPAPVIAKGPPLK